MPPACPHLLRGGFRPRLLLNADLVGTVDLSRLPNPLVPGDSVTIPVQVVNQGDQPAVGKIAVALYVSADQTLAGAMPIVTLANQSLNLAPGKSKTLIAKLVIGSDAPAGAYYILANIDPQHVVAGDDPANNLAVSAQQRSLVYQFGAVPGRTGSVKLVFQGDGGGTFTLSLKGNGMGQVFPGADPSDLTLTGADAGSAMSVTLKGVSGHVQIGNITLGSVKSISAGGVDLLGNLTATGTLGSLTLGDIAGPSTITIQGAGVPLTFTARCVTDLVLDCASPIKAITVANWAPSIGAPDDANLIIAPSLGSLRVNGDKKTGLPGAFGAGVQLSGAASGPTLGSAKVAGAITGGVWRVTGAVGSIAAASTATGWSASFSGDLKGLTTAGDASGDLAARNIAGLTVKGSLVGARMLAGADLGADGRLGGEGVDADSFGPGGIMTLKVTGGVTGAIIGAGLDPIDGVFNNAGDRTVGGAASAIKSLSVGGSLDAASRFFAAAFPKTVKIGGVTVNPLVDPRLVAGLADIGLSRSSANPGSTLAVTGSGFVPDATTDVIFTYDSGDALRLRAIPGSVTETQVEVIVPPFFDAEAFEFTSGTVIVGLDQGTNVLYTPVDGFEINALSSTGEPAGSVLLETLDLLRNQAVQVAVRWETIEAVSKGAVKVAPVIAGIVGMMDALAMERNLIDPLVAGQVSSIHLGKIRGKDFVLNADSLALVDQLLITCFLGDDAPGAGLALSAMARADAASKSDTMIEYDKKFDADLSASFSDVFKTSEKYVGIGKAAIDDFLFVATAFGKLSVETAASVSGVAGAALFWFTTVTPAVMNACVLSMAEPFVELELGRPPTWDAYMPAGKYLLKGSADYVGDLAEGRLIDVKSDKSIAAFLNLDRSGLQSTLALIDPEMPTSTGALAFKSGEMIYDALHGVPDLIKSQTGANSTQAFQAVLAATGSNPTGDLVPGEAVACAQQIVNGQQTPGIVVEPTSGLQTSEDGASDNFTVALKTKPTANVTIALQSSDATEGAVSKKTLTFTPVNWNVDQTVTVTGVNDSIVDGDQAYTIVTRPAVSNDPVYKGLDAADVTATNKDNDEAEAPSVSLDPLSVLERNVEWFGGMFGSWWVQFKVAASGTAAGPIGTYRYGVGGDWGGEGSMSDFVQDAWTGEGDRRAAGDPSSTHFAFEVYSRWFGLSMLPATLTISVGFVLVQGDGYLEARDTKTIVLQ